MDHKIPVYSGLEYAIVKCSNLIGHDRALNHLQPPSGTIHVELPPPPPHTHTHTPGYTKMLFMGTIKLKGVDKNTILLIQNMNLLLTQTNINKSHHGYWHSTYGGNSADGLVHLSGL